jgi:lipopolysaccharide heptosyltransferase II
MPLNKSKINKILVISLTNIGDVMLTCPVVDILKNDFPGAKLSIVVGPKAASLFRGNPYLDKAYVYHKRQSLLKTISWIYELRKEHFDLIIDLRNTAIPFLISPKFRTSFHAPKINNIHMKEKHLNRLKSVYPYATQSQKQYALNVSDEDKGYVEHLIKTEIGPKQRFIMVCPGAADHVKRWSEAGFAQVCDQLINSHHLKIVFSGDEEDRKVAQRIHKNMVHDAVNLCGRTNLVQLAELFRHCLLAIVNDSAPLHIASYLDIPVLALFGPTDPPKYGPWSSQCLYIKSKLVCLACQNAKGQTEHTCMKAITSEEILQSFDITDEGVIFNKL